MTRAKRIIIAPLASAVLALGLGLPAPANAAPPIARTQLECLQGFLVDTRPGQGSGIGYALSPERIETLTSGRCPASPAAGQPDERLAAGGEAPGRME